VNDWDEETTKYDPPRLDSGLSGATLGGKGLKYYTFTSDLMLRTVHPTFGMHYGGQPEGGYVQVFGSYFVNVTHDFPDHTNLMKCSFEWVESRAIYVSTSLILCEVPNMIH
jgi:hypothetical protein